MQQHLQAATYMVLKSKLSPLKKVTVAGRDSIKFIGTVNNDDEWDCHVYGYTFIINNKAYALIGLVSAKEQDPEMIKEIDERIDKMAATIRTTK